MEDKIAANYQEIIGSAPPVDENELQQPIEDPVPFSNKIVQAKVQIIRPNEERARKKKMTTVSQEPETVLAQADIPITREEKPSRLPNRRTFSPPRLRRKRKVLLSPAFPMKTTAKETTKTTLSPTNRCRRLSKSPKPHRTRIRRLIFRPKSK